MDVGRAIKRVTIDAARTLGVEERVGTIETGEFAVLEADPQEADPSTIKDIGGRRHDPGRPRDADRRDARSAGGMSLAGS